MYVLYMYVCVSVCIDFDDVDYFFESNILTDVYMSMDLDSICSHHSNSLFIFHTSLSQFRTI